MGETTFDLETDIIRPGMPAPPPVCLAWSRGSEKGLLIREEMEPFLPELLASDLIIGHNVIYDLLVSYEWFPDFRDAVLDALRENRVLDTMLLERIGQIQGQASQGPLALDEVVVRYGMPRPSKDTAIRLTFGRYLNGGDLPAAHREYAQSDAVITQTLLKRQRGRIGFRQQDMGWMVRTAFARNLTSARGLRTRASGIEDLRKGVESQIDHLLQRALDNGFLVRKTDAKFASDLRHRQREGKEGEPSWFSKKMEVIKGAVTEAYEGAAPKTDKGGVATDRVTLEDSGDPELEAFAGYGQSSAILAKDLPLLEAGVHQPIHTRMSWAATLRSISSNPNIQNLRGAPGIRECFAPREGHCFVQFDIGGLELGTFAQLLIWRHARRSVADAINDNHDYHCGVAAVLMGIPYKEAFARKQAGCPELKKNRDISKVALYGRMGGMSWKKLVPYGRGRTPPVFLEKEFCEGPLRNAVEAAMPEIPFYLKQIRKLKNPTDLYDLAIPGTHIMRRNATYCAAANTGFQGLGAVVTGHIHWLLAEACLRGALRGCALLAFIHDEWIMECPIGRQDKMSKVARSIVRNGSAEILPDVPLDSAPCAMSVWSKMAEAIYTDGELQIWKP